MGVSYFFVATTIYLQHGYITIVSDESDIMISEKLGGQVWEGAISDRAETAEMKKISISDLDFLHFLHLTSPLSLSHNLAI